MLDWAALTVGETFGPYRYEVSVGVVRQYRLAVGGREVEEVDGDAVAPPTILTFPFLQWWRLWREDVSVASDRRASVQRCERGGLVTPGQPQERASGLSLSHFVRSVGVTC